MNMFRSRSPNLSVSRAWDGLIRQRGKAFGYMIFGALIAFELFNFSTTKFALQDVLGNITFMGLEWATILAIAFCGIDFAGIARIFTPEQGRDEPAEVWYLFGAWLLAAGMNAMLTWWGVSVAIQERQTAGTAVISSAAMTKIVPVFVAVMVWVIRVLIIGTFSVAGEGLFQHQTSSRRPAGPRPSSAQPSPARPRPAAGCAPGLVPAQLPERPGPGPSPRPEPTYHNTTNERPPGRLRGEPDPRIIRVFGGAARAAGGRPAAMFAQLNIAWTMWLPHPISDPSLECHVTQ